MKIGIATNSVDKIMGLKVAFVRFLQIEEAELEVVHHSVASEVEEQPFDEDTYRGAMNRVNNLRKLTKADFYVACEAGIESFLGRFFNVQVICIFDVRTQKYHFGKSSGWEIPAEDIDEIRSSDLDRYLRGKGFTCLEDVLGKGYSRANAITQATEHALSSRTL